MEAPLQNYVNSVASAVCSSDIGAQWLSSYIDPAHGQCYVFPDEDTNYSCAIRTKNIQAINASTFVSSNYTGNVPDVFNFVIYSTITVHRSISRRRNKTLILESITCIR